MNAIVLTEVFEYSAYDRQSNNFNMVRLLDNWDTFLSQSGHNAQDYVNPFWRPRGIPAHTLPAAKRGPSGSELNEESQVVGRNWKKYQKSEQSV